MAEVALDGSEVGGLHRQFSQVALSLGDGDRLLQRKGRLAQASEHVEHIGVVGPEAAALLGGATGLDQRAIRLDDRQRLCRASRLGEPDRMQSRRCKSRPGRFEVARQRGGLDRGGDAARMVGRHQRRQRARVQRRDALLRRARIGQQAVDDAMRGLDAAHDDAGRHAVASRLESLRRFAGAVEGLRGLVPVVDFVRAL